MNNSTNLQVRNTRLVLERYTLVERTPAVVIGPVPPDQAAGELLAYLHRHGYLAAGDPD